MSRAGIVHYLSGPRLKQFSLGKGFLSGAAK